MRDYEPVYGTLERGEQVNVNHRDCPAGEDTRRRLYIKRPESQAGLVVAFCHNCQEHGVVRDKVSKYRQFGTYPAPSPQPQVEFAIPANMVEQCSLWPHDATQWRIEKRLSSKQCEDAGIKYDPASHRVFLPMEGVMAPPGVSIAKEMMGFQLRQIDGRGPKYYTALREQDTIPYTLIGGKPARLTVLVEDLASGLALSMAQTRCSEPVEVLVNYGVKCKPEVLNSFSIQRGLVWLDNDGEHIKDAARTIARTWQLISGSEVLICEKETDPKLWDHEALTNLLEEYLHD
jgi:hypothetical protein